ncbi:hypothetical protein AK812_SmicGene280 [Symbiodinium microadriaticum]|uniref:Uncharacterized protein n=1 Tax=Symbiodinium microadriaticum TaxID=2951 RepID=A0A1Q9F749_SYMMI|nr:hypothetical protein AK812_SmicGene280 [Symbiodinium microadriaticum]
MTGISLSATVQVLARSASEPAGKELPRAPNNKGLPKRMHCTQQFREKQSSSTCGHGEKPYWEPWKDDEPDEDPVDEPEFDLRSQRAVGSVSPQLKKRPAGVPVAFQKIPKPGEPPKAFRVNASPAVKAAPQQEEMEEVLVDGHSEDPTTPPRKAKEAWPRTPEPRRNKDLVADAMGRGFGQKLQMATRAKGSVGAFLKEEKEVEAPGKWLFLLEEKPKLETAKKEKKEWKIEEAEAEKKEEFELEEDDEEMDPTVDDSSFEGGGEEPDQSLASGSVEDSNSDDTSGRDEVLLPGASVGPGRIDLRNYGQEFQDDKEKQIEQNNRIAARWGGKVQVPLASGTAQSRKGSCLLKGQVLSVVSRLRRNPPPPSPGKSIVSSTESTGTLQPQEPPYPPPPKRKKARGGAGAKARAAARRRGDPIESVAIKFRIKKEKGGQGSANEVREVFASDVLFSQDSMKDCFQCGRTLESTVEQLLRKEILPSHPIFRRMNLYETERGVLV